MYKILPSSFKIKPQRTIFNSPFSWFFSGFYHARLCSDQISDPKILFLVLYNKKTALADEKLSKPNR